MRQFKVSFLFFILLFAGITNVWGGGERETSESTPSLIEAIEQLVDLDRRLQTLGIFMEREADWMSLLTRIADRMEEQQAQIQQLQVQSQKLASVSLQRNIAIVAAALLLAASVSVLVLKRRKKIT